MAGNQCRARRFSDVAIQHRIPCLKPGRTSSANSEPALDACARFNVHTGHTCQDEGAVVGDVSNQEVSLKGPEGV